MNLTTHNIITLAQSYGLDRLDDGQWDATSENLIALFKAAHAEGVKDGRRTAEVEIEALTIDLALLRAENIRLRHEMNRKPELQR